MDKGFRTENAENRHQNPAAARQKDGCTGCTAGFVPVSSAERAGDQCGNADARSGCQADHNILCRKSKRKRRKAVFRNLRDIDAVHYIVQSLHQHGEDHRDRHLQQQFPFVHLPHQVCFKFF